MVREDDKINVYGARVHNLKNIDVEIPRQSLTVITGLSGSGKSSLAFDTIFAEGQRRYIETFSAYARNFLGGMERPDVDKITGLSPVISIEQKTTNKNPRSTVGTTTEVYDYMRLLFARAGRAYSYASGEPMVKYTEERVLEMIMHDYAGHRIFILAPLVRSRKGHYRELFEAMRRKGYLNIRVDGQMQEITRGMKVDRYKNHDIEVVIDKLQVAEKDVDRLKKSVAIAMKQGEGLIMILDKDSGAIKHFSKRLMDPVTGISYSDPAPNNFSFNSPQGACPHCKGLGIINQIDLGKVIPDRQASIYEGGIVPLGKYKNQMIFWQVEAILKRYECNLKTPIADIPEEAMREVLYGSLENVRIDKEVVHTTSDYFVAFDGIIKYLRGVMENDDSAAGQKWADQFLVECECPECHGQRLNHEALSYRVWDKNISELASMDITELREWLDHVEEHLDHQQQQIAHEILKEIRTRLDFLLEVGLDYLALNRPSASLSGGESQRIRLATQIGSQLVNVLYILDEPSIGLHQRDNERLIRSLKELRDLGNTVIVVEHDEDMMRNADWIIDIGPRAGRKGGEVVFQGTPQAMLQTQTVTAQYLNGQQQIAIPSKRREGSRPQGLHGQQPETCRRGVPPRAAHPRHRCQRLRQVHPHQRDTAAHPLTAFLPFTEAPHALRQHRGTGVYRQGGQRRPVTHRAYTALQPCHLYGCLRRHPLTVCQPARGQDTRLQARTLLIQREGRTLRDLRRQRLQDHRDELPARHTSALRGMPRPPVQP